MPIQAVLFDLDGTLLDTIEDLADSVNAVLELLDCPTHEVPAYLIFVGDGIHALLERALPAARRDPATIARGVEMARDEYGRRWDHKTRPYPGVDVLLDGLVARGLRIGILSNKPHDYTVLTTEKLLAPWSFDLVWGVKADVPRKPEPTGALKAAATLGVDPGNCIFCGDTNTDMKTAVAAGMRGVGAEWGFRDRAELEASGAEIVLAQPPDLLELV